MPNPVDQKIKTDVCVRAHLEFGFPKELIAQDLKISLERVSEAEHVFGGSKAFPSTVVDSMEYFCRFNDFLNRPMMPIEDATLLLSIDRSRARILIEIFSRWFHWNAQEKKLMIDQTLATILTARANPGKHFGVGLAFVEYSHCQNPRDHQH